MSLISQDPVSIIQNIIDGMNYLVTWRPHPGILYYGPQPFLFTVASLIGYVTVVIGLTRLVRNGKGQQMMGRHTSPLATTMYFIAGLTMISLQPVIQTLEFTIFGQYTSPDIYLHTGDISSLIQYQAFSSLKEASSVIDPGKIISDLAFASLRLIGFFSFMRGIMMLVKLGEGQGPEGVSTKCFTHIVAGMIAINAPALFGIINFF